MIDLVKYHNNLNSVVFGKFTANEMNLFFSIISKLKDKGEDTIIFSWEELKDLSRYKPTHIQRFVNDLDKTYKKMLELNYGQTFVKKNRLTYSRFVLFTSFNIDCDMDDNGDLDVSTGVVSIKINPDLRHILNDLEQWTQYSLEEFIKLKSTYSKTIFRLLKQFRTTGYLKLTIQEFREQLDIPKSYRMSHINQKVISVAEKELKRHFKDLKINKIKAKKKGAPVVAIEFTWKSEKTGTFIDYSKKSQPREMTPEWLKDEGKINQSTHGMSEKELEIEREKLRKELENIWEGK
ncbi:RepB family plasmid replication initiator protein [Macrococcoides bohemicum]|uniref:replication initiation protein n=1 Tax=Macrococcoides bohemicum TaxID=1903056 RepID=UPI00105A2234|nr:replication initiation protein [Macrococcus bohemicus]TDL33183.1 RepB family plasmid replication initiator protein [Macrococcus bohemicus]